MFIFDILNSLLDILDGEEEVDCYEDEPDYAEHSYDGSGDY